MKTAHNAGQALVLVLLSLAVVLTLVLFILSRTITDIAVSTTEEEAIRAFSAAEAGVEKALIIGSVGETSIGDASFTADVSEFAEGLSAFNYPITLSPGDTATIWFAENDGEGNLTPSFTGGAMKVCWGEDATPIDNNTPAVEISVFYDSGTVLIGRSALDPNASGRSLSNSFTPVATRDCTIDGVAYEFWSDVDLDALTQGNTAGLLFARVRMLYNADKRQSVGFDVTGEGLLPSQGQMIVSTGQSGDANRRLEVFQGWGEPPPIFDSAVFSATGLTK